MTSTSRTGSIRADTCVNVAVFKAADDFGNGVRFPDVAEEFIAQAFTLGGTGYEAGNIDETRYLAGMVRFG